MHIDLCGPVETASVERARYLLIFMDDFSWEVLSTIKKDNKKKTVSIRKRRIRRNL